MQLSDLEVIVCTLLRVPLVHIFLVHIHAHIVIRINSKLEGQEAGQLYE